MAWEILYGVGGVLGNFVWGCLVKFCMGVLCYGIFNLGCRVSNALCMEPRCPLLSKGVVGVGF